MSKESSFDIVSDFDYQELVNAIDQTRRDISSRFDLKDSGSEVDVQEQKTIVITTTDETRLKNILDILETKVIKRGLDVKILDPGQVEQSLGGKVKQHINLKKGIDKELGKKIVSEIKATKLKVQPSIQGEQVRVSGKDKDELQMVIKHIRDQADRWQVPLQFSNYR